MTSPRREVTEPEPTSTSSALLESCARLRKLSYEAEVWKKREGDAGKLLERRDALRQYRDALDQFAAAVQALRTVKGLSPAVSKAVQRLAPHQRAVERLADRCRKDPASITQAKALDGLRLSDFSTIEEPLLAAWLAHVGAEQHPGLEVVLEKFPKLRGAAKAVSAARSALQKMAQNLPRTTASIAACEAERRKLSQALSDIEEGGVDDHTLEFLRSSFEGVSLERVLSDKDILSWINEHGLAGQFVVRSR